jgi:hypothetical protein
VEIYPEVLNGITAAEIQCVGVTNKEWKAGKPLFELRAVDMPIRMDCPYSFYVIVAMDVWNGRDEAHQAALVMEVLCSISREGDNKIVPFDMKGHSVMFRTLGVDYHTQPNIPNILEGKTQWKKDKE